MKNIIVLSLLITILIVSFISCGGPERFCDKGESFEFRPDSLILSYFDHYKRSNQIIFESKNRFDTLFVLSNVFDTTGIEDCFNYINKEVSIYSRSIFNSDTAIITMGISSNNKTSFINIIEANEKKTVSIVYVTEKKQFQDPPEELIRLDSFYIKTKLYLNVVKVKSLDNSSFFYFSPNNGIIKWENKTDTFIIKN